MTKDQQNLYDDMIHAIDAIVPDDALEVNGACFYIALQQWNKLKDLVKDNREMEDKTRAIEFFKYTKPLFTGRIQYFTMISESLMFVPRHSDDALDYWRKEMERLPRYLVRNRAFVAYYDSGTTDLDEKYFLQVSLYWQPTDKQFYYDADLEFCSSHDHMVRGLIAHRLYHGYVQAKIKELLELTDNA